jgi:hypothetical protein
MRPSFACLLALNMVAAVTTELTAQSPAAASIARQQFNQVFVKVIVPVTPNTPKQDGPVVESWVAEQLKKRGESEYFAVTGWVPVCDGLLEDDIVNNDVWDGRLKGEYRYCPVGGDIPERENGRLLVNLRGWMPGGDEANISLSDEPGSRAVGPVRLGMGKEGNRSKIEEGLPYVAVMIAPPPQAGATPHGNAK